MSEHWTNYWKQGFLTSFGGGIKGNYQGKLKRLWLDHSKKISPGSHVLDIGTGNGALLDLLQSNHTLDLVGIDRAEINNEISDSINGVFHSKVSAESMPFEDDQFDVVIAQFALEYTDLDFSLSEVFRVLKKNGLFIFVCHNPESIIVKPNEQILNEAKLILKNMQSYIYELSLAMIINDEKSISLKYSMIKDYIENRKRTHIDAIIGTNLPLFLDFLYSNRNKNIDFVEAARQFENELQLLVLRLDELVDASKKSITLINQLKLLNKDIEVREVYENGELIASYVKAIK